MYHNNSIVITSQATKNLYIKTCGVIALAHACVLVLTHNTTQLSYLIYNTIKLHNGLLSCVVCVCSLLMDVSTMIS